MLISLGRSKKSRAEASAFAPPSSRVSLENPVGDRPRVRIGEHELRDLLRPALGVAEGNEAAETGAEDDRPLDADPREQAVEVGRPGLDVPRLRRAAVAEAAATEIDVDDLRELAARRGPMCSL